MRLASMQRGDTIIEVMVAFSVFAMVAVGALTVMNQGTAGAQNTLETTLVRQEIDAQAEMLRFLHQAYTSNPGASTGPSSKFAAILARAQTAALTQPTEFGDNADQPCTQVLPGESSKRFALNNEGTLLADENTKPIQDLDISANAPYAKVDTDNSPQVAYGIWIEPVISNATNNDTRFIDFHIRACWESASGDNQRTLGTIIRLYTPTVSSASSFVPVALAKQGDVS